jgi:hypothetical protein
MLLIVVWLNCIVVAELKETVGFMGSAMAISITSAGVLPFAGMVSPLAYLPKVLPPDKDTVKLSGKT